MSTTFYGVLGVGPEADAATIREGYRQRVKDVHPDVNEDTDADVQFKRLTTARDVLLDDTERARYDRIGHVSYVRHHVDCSAWVTASSPVERPRESPTSTDRAGPRTRRTDATRKEGPVETARDALGARATTGPRIPVPAVGQVGIGVPAALPAGRDRVLPKPRPPGGDPGRVGPRRTDRASA